MPAPSNLEISIFRSSHRCIKSTGKYNISYLFTLLYFSTRAGQKNPPNILLIQCSLTGPPGYVASVTGLDKRPAKYPGCFSCPASCPSRLCSFFNWAGQKACQISGYFSCPAHCPSPLRSFCNWAGQTGCQISRLIQSSASSPAARYVVSVPGLNKKSA